MNATVAPKLTRNQHRGGWNCSFATKPRAAGPSDLDHRGVSTRARNALSRSAALHGARESPCARSFADKSYTGLPQGHLSATSFLHPPPQALLIKNNLASREIKPTVAVKWHQLPEYPSTPPLASSHSNDSRLHRVLSPRPPPAPHYRRLTGPSAIWLLCTLDIYTEGGRDPHSHARKFNSQAFRAVAK